MKFLLTVEVDAKDDASADDVLIWAASIFKDRPSVRVVSARPKPGRPEFPSMTPSPFERDKKQRPT